MITRDFPKALACVALCELAGLAGAFFTAEAIPAWYAGLAKPWFTPPNYVFAPVWTLLYLIMGVALFLVLQTRAAPGKKRSAYSLFAIQLLLNFLWSMVFFGFKQILFALLVIVALWLAIAWTALKFKCFSRLAAWLLAPYLAWVSFAAALNFAVWQLNPGV